MGFEQGQIVDANGATVFASAVCPRGYFPRLRGLIGRAPLGDQQAWWFDHCSSIHTFGMRHAIDVVHLDAAGRVLRVRKAVKPLAMSAARRGRVVVELGAGMAARAGIHPGQTLYFKP